MTNHTIPEKYLDLFEKPAYGHLATLMPDGSPQVTPVWVDYDGEYLIVNAARGRQKVRNMIRDPRVAVAIQDPDEPYRYLQVRGRVVEVTEEGAAAQIDKMEKKYRGNDHYTGWKPGMVRVLFKIKPENF